MTCNRSVMAEDVEPRDEGEDGNCRQPGGGGEHRSPPGHTALGPHGDDGDDGDTIGLGEMPLRSRLYLSWREIRYMFAV